MSSISLHIERGYHLTEASGGSWSTGSTLGVLCHGTLHDPETGLLITTAPQEWVEGKAAIEGLNLQDFVVMQLLRAWDRWLNDPEVVALALADHGRAKLEELLWLDHGLRGQDAAVVVERTIDAVARKKIVEDAAR